MSSYTWPPETPRMSPPCSSDCTGAVGQDEQRGIEAGVRPRQRAAPRIEAGEGQADELLGLVERDQVPR
jgi:hypothetical protein